MAPLYQQDSINFNTIKNPNAKYKIIDLFAGIGGIRLGFEKVFKDQASFVFSSEIDKYAQITYNSNFNEVPYGDITQIKEEDIPPHDIILAGFPCQAFSIAGHRKGFEDTRGTLFFDVARIAKYHKPKLIFLENVKGFINHNNGNTFKVIKKTLEDMGYKVFADVLNAKNFGIPQNRERIYIIAFLDHDKSINFNKIKMNKKKSKLGDILENYVNEEFTISDKLWEGHQRRKKEHQLKGNGFGYSIFNESSEYTSTISARYYKDGSEILIEQKNKNPRKLTPREAARLQGFPDSFKIPVSNTQAYKQFGNSVSVPVIEELAANILFELESKSDNIEEKNLESENINMEIKKLEVEKSKFDINLKFYFFLKFLVKSKLIHNQTTQFLRIYISNDKKDIDNMIRLFLDVVDKQTKNSLKQKELLSNLFVKVTNEEDLKLFIFSLKLYIIKDLLLQEAKIKDYLDISKLEHLDPLSTEYDDITLFSPYSTRINGALLSLIFFEKLENNETNFMSSNAEEFIKSLSIMANDLVNQGVEPNQIFMLMFSESINQSIISNSGYNYEDRILSVLTSIGIDKKAISKIHDKDDSSTEFDFFFELNNKTYGIGAKRTLRERYKQFIKTAQMTKIDVMIEITLGMDLTKEKVKAIRNHDVYLFVSNEVYYAHKYLQEQDGVFSSSQLTLDVLKSL